MPIELVCAIVVALIAVGACAWLTADRRALKADRDRLAGEVAGKQDELEAVKRERADLTTQLRDQFKSVGVDVLKQFKDDFRQDATAQLDQRKQAIEMMLDPIRKTLDKHDQAVRQLEAKREGAYHALRQQVTGLLQPLQQLSKQTTTLETALRGSSSTRGRWGELTLRRIAEIAGMVAHCDFDEQVTVWKGDAAQRPDMLVRLPNDRSIVIDAKSVGQNYYEALNATDDDSRSRLMHGHAKHLESRVKELAGKAYTERLACTPDFVVLFIPGESFLQPVMELKPDLIQSAMTQGVVIATPTILISLLRVVEMGWREEKLAENARRISDLGQDLHQRIATAYEHADKLGLHLDKAVKSYNQYLRSLETRVLVSTRKFKELGADSSKELPAEGVYRQIDVTPVEVRPLSET